MYLGRSGGGWGLQRKLHLEPGLLRRDRIVGEHLLLTLVGRNTQRLAGEHLLLGRSAGGATEIGTTKQFALRAGCGLWVKGCAAEHVSGLAVGHVTARGCVLPAGSRGCAKRTERATQQEACTEGNEGFFTIPLDHQRGEGGDVRLIQLRTQFRIEDDTVSDLCNSLGRTFEGTGTNTTGDALAQRASGYVVHDGAQRGREPTGDNGRGHRLDASLKQRGHDDVRLDIRIGWIKPFGLGGFPRRLQFHREDRRRNTEQTPDRRTNGAANSRTSGSTAQTRTDGHPESGCRLDSGSTDLTQNTLLLSDGSRACPLSVRHTNRFTCLYKRTADTLSAQHLEATARAADQPLTHVTCADTKVAHKTTAFGDRGQIPLVLSRRDAPEVAPRWGCSRTLCGGAERHVVVFAAELHTAYREAVHARAVVNVATRLHSRLRWRLQTGPSPTAKTSDTLQRLLALDFNVRKSRPNTLRTERW